MNRSTGRYQKQNTSILQGHYQKRLRTIRIGENVTHLCISGKISVPRIYEELLQTNDKENTVKNWSKYLIRCFQKELTYL